MKLSKILKLFPVLLAAVLVSCVSVQQNEDDEFVPLLEGQRLAIFDFEVKSSVPGYEALATDVPQALAEALLAGENVRPVERSSLEKVLREQELSLSGVVDERDAIKLGKLAGASHILLGTVTIIGDQARISCRVINVETGEIVYAGSAVGDLDEIFEIEAELAELIEVDFSSY